MSLDKLRNERYTALSQAVKLIAKETPIKMQPIDLYDAPEIQTGNSGKIVMRIILSLRRR